MLPIHIRTDAATIVSVTLRLAPVLPTNVAVVQFQDVKAATEAATDLLNHGIGLRASIIPDVTA